MDKYTMEDIEYFTSGGFTEDMPPLEGKLLEYWEGIFFIPAHALFKDGQIVNALSAGSALSRRNYYASIGQECDHYLRYCLPQ
jgi:hypothetical protein